MARVGWCDCFVVFCIVASSGDVNSHGCSSSSSGGGGFLAEVISRIVGMCKSFEQVCCLVFCQVCVHITNQLVATCMFKT